MEDSVEVQVVPETTHGLFYVFLILLMIIIGVGIYLYIYLYSSYPDIKHEENCVEINKKLDEMGIAADSPIRYELCPDSIYMCAVEFRPSETEPQCPEGRTLNGSSISWPDPDPILGPCCTAAAPVGEQTDSTITESLIDTAKSHPVITSGIGLFVLNKITKGSVTRVASKATSLTGTVLKKVTGNVGKKLVSKLTGKLATMGTMSALGPVGWAANALMNVGMLLDFASDSATQYSQFVSNRTFLDMRDSIEGMIISSRSDIGEQPPFYFTLDKLDASSVLTEDNNLGSEDYKPFGAIYAAYKEAIAAYSAKVITDSTDPESSNYLDGEKLNLFLDYIDAVIENPDDDTIELDDSVIDHITSSFHENPYERDMFIWDTLKSSKHMKSEYLKYIEKPDESISTDTVHSLTLSYPEGYNAWNNFVINNHGGVLPMAVYSEYYRVLESQRPGTADDPIKNTDRHRIRDGIESVLADPEEIDMTGQTVYTLKTEKLAQKRMQYSLSKGIIDVKCRHGMHMPSIATLLTGIAEQKLCINAGNVWTSGKCSNDEFSLNELECEATGATWTPATCIGDGNTDDSLMAGILQTGISGYTTTIHAASNAVANARAEAVGSPPVDRNLQDAMYDAFHPGASHLDEDIFPNDFGVAYDDDTGICIFNDGSCSDSTYSRSQEICEDAGETWTLASMGAFGGRHLAWCDRMGMDEFKNETDDSLHADQTYTDCDTSFSQDVLSGIFGQTIGRGVAEFMDEYEAAFAWAEEVLLPDSVNNFIHDEGSGGLRHFRNHPVDAVETFFTDTIPDWFD